MNQMRELNAFLDKIVNEDLRRAVDRYLRCYPDFYSVPASLSHHHVFTGGTLVHTLEVCSMGLKIIESCNLDVDEDWFLAAAILHDVGKVDEYEWSDEEHKWVRKTKKQRIDHSLKPILNFQILTEYELPKSIQLAILSHMGGWSQTSVYPDDLLSALLHSCDLLSSRIVRGTSYEGGL